MLPFGREFTLTGVRSGRFPAGLLEIMRRLGVKPEETLLVGDADVDVLGGAAGGVDTLLIRHNRAVELHITAKTWHTVASPTEAFSVVLSCVQNNSPHGIDT